MTNLHRVTVGWYRTVFCNNLITTVVSCLLTTVFVVTLLADYLYFGPVARRVFNYSGVLMAALSILGVLVGFYALIRGLAFHPALDFRYHEWLKATPWAPGATLPKGPITPTWQDCVLLIIATIFALLHSGQTDRPEFVGLLPTLMMALGFTLSWTAANVVTGNVLAVYTTLLCMPLTMHLLFSTPQSMFAVAAVVGAGIAYWGVRAGLGAYPWDIVPFNKYYLQRLLNPYQERTANWQTISDVGWPYAQLLMAPKDVRVPLLRAVFEAAIVAAWVALIGRGIDDEIWFWVFLVGNVLVGAKVYCNALVICSQLCFGRRVALRRPVLWNHDRWLLQPIAIGAVMLGLGYGWVGLGLGPHWVGAALTVAVGVVLCRRLGSPIEEGYFTGRQSLRGVSRQAQHFEKLASPGE